MCNTSQSCLEQHASACEKVKRCSNVRDTHKTEKNVRATRWSVCTPRARQSQEAGVFSRLSMELELGIIAC